MKKLLTKDLMILTEVALTAAEKAGALIASSRQGKHLQISHKPGQQSEASQVLTQIDLQAQKLILEELRPSMAQYDLALLAEESADDKSRLIKDYFWCVDPIDGTLPFIEGRAGYAVCISLISRNGVPQIGVVYDPHTHCLYHAVRGMGAFRNKKPWQLSSPQGEYLSFIGDRSFLKDPRFKSICDRLENVAEQMGLRGVKLDFGAGAAMNSIEVLLHSPACYFKLPKNSPGGGSIWDFAASACIYQELQAPALNICGQALQLNEAETTFMNRQGVLFASSSALSVEVTALASEFL